MRRAFCFSRIWSRYSLSLGRLRPCSPGGYGRISIGHFGESHLAPLRNSFIFSRRHRLQSGPVYRAICQFLSDPAPLRRAAAIVGDRGDVLDGADLQAGRLQRPDRGFPAGAGAFHEHIDLPHAVLHGAARGGLGRHLGGVRRRLARPLEAHLARGGPGDDVADRVGDRDDRVVEGAPDVSMSVGDVLAFLPAHLLGGAGTALWRHLLPVREVVGPGCGLLLAGLLLAGHGLLPALAGPGVRLGPLAMDRQPAAVADALIAADLHLAPDVALNLTAQVTFYPVGGIDPVAELDEVVVGQVVHPGVTADAGGLQRPLGAGAADPVDVGEGDLKALVAREVDTDQTCHARAVLLRFGRSHTPRPVPAQDGPRPPAGGGRYQAKPGAGCGAPDAPLPLALLVPRVGADDHDAAMPADDPAFAADLLHARLDLHRGLLVGPGGCPAGSFVPGSVPRRPPVLSRGGGTTGSLLVPVDDAAAAQVVGAQLPDHPVIGEDPDVVHPHLPADVSQDLVPVVQLHPEEGIR